MPSHDPKYVPELDGDVDGDYGQHQIFVSAVQIASHELSIRFPKLFETVSRWWIRLFLNKIKVNWDLDSKIYYGSSTILGRATEISTLKGVRSCVAIVEIISNPD